MLRVVPAVAGSSASPASVAAVPSPARPVFVYFITPARQFQAACFHNCFGQLEPPCPQNPAHCLPGNIHNHRCFPLVQAVIIDKAHCLKFLKRQYHLSGFLTPLWTKFGHHRWNGYISGSFGSRHGPLLFGHLIIIYHAIRICQDNNGQMTKNL